MAEEVVVDGKAVRYNEGKIRWRLVPLDGIEELAKVYEAGSKKYADRNWEKGQSYATVYDSMMRHIKDWWQKGLDYDSDDGMLLVAKIAWNALALTTFEARGMREELDDRPRISRPANVEEPIYPQFDPPIHAITTEEAEKLREWQEAVREELEAMATAQTTSLFPSQEEIDECEAQRKAEMSEVLYRDGAPKPIPPAHLAALPGEEWQEVYVNRKLVGVYPARQVGDVNRWAQEHYGVVDVETIKARV